MALISLRGCFGVGTAHVQMYSWSVLDVPRCLRWFSNAWAAWAAGNPFQRLEVGGIPRAPAPASSPESHRGATDAGGQPYGRGNIYVLPEGAWLPVRRGWRRIQ